MASPKPANTTPSTLPAKSMAQVSSAMVGTIERSVAGLIKDNRLQLPPDYSAANALRAATLILAETVDRDRVPVLQSCSRASIASALMAMVVQGLDPGKKQGYFIAYAGKLSFQRSVFGAQALAKRYNPKIKGFVSGVVFDGDDFAYEIDATTGRTTILKHTQTLASRNSKKVLGAYASAVDENGEIINTEIMGWDEILVSWKQSKAFPFVSKDSYELKADSTHAQFPGEMSKRTVLNRLCKTYINTADDSHLLAKAIGASDTEPEAVTDFTVGDWTSEDFDDTPIDHQPSSPTSADGTADPNQKPAPLSASQASFMDEPS